MGAKAVWEEPFWSVPELLVPVSVPGSWCLMAVSERLPRSPAATLLASDLSASPLPESPLCFPASVDANLCQVLGELFVCELRWS